MTQADIDRRQAKDAAVYAKRAQWALRNLQSAQYRLRDDNVPGWQREVGRMARRFWYAGEQVRESWYLTALYRQAAAA